MAQALADQFEGGARLVSPTRKRTPQIVRRDCWRTRSLSRLLNDQAHSLIRDPCRRDLPRLEYAGECNRRVIVSVRMIRAPGLDCFGDDRRQFYLTPFSALAMYCQHPIRPLLLQIAPCQMCNFVTTQATHR